MQALDKLIQSTLAMADNQMLAAPFDPDWRSPCERYQSENLTWWQPTAQETPVTFAGVENALELTIHDDIKAYYSSYWSGTLEADSEEGRVSLIQLWNPEDFERLVANLIGHAIAKHRLKQPLTVFFANTEPDSELFLSIDNETGVILLENPGKPPLRQVDENIEKFLGRLNPQIRPPDIY